MRLVDADQHPAPDCTADILRRIRDERNGNQLWDLANIITGFAVAQSLAFLYALAKSEFAKDVYNTKAIQIVIPVTVIASVLYSVAVYFVGLEGASLAKTTQEQEIWKSITGGRIAAILVFNDLVLFVIRRNRRKA